jgi:uroporphyrinogen decarboxylase
LRNPDFNNLLKVLNRQTPDRPTLFEFFLNEPLYRKLAGAEIASMEDKMAWPRTMIHAYKNAGYDYVTLQGSNFHFHSGEVNKAKTYSINEGGVIHDRKSFEEYDWPEPDKYDYSRLQWAAGELPEGMKVIVWGPGGVLENVIRLTGYETLCYLTLDDPELTRDIFDAVGSRLLRYYEICAGFETVGALISNDDWGFKTQTMLHPADMRRYVFPWHKRIVETAHAAGKPAILHSCGNLEEVMDDIIDEMQFDGKHSFEDAIEPVEKAYERWGSRIAILGGIDMDFVCRSTPEEIRKRSVSMLERSAQRGSYALGSGNSIPEYVPDENYLAMIEAVLD